MKTSQLVLHREIIAVCYEIHTEHINTLCGQNVEFFFMLNLVVHIVTTWLYKGHKHVCSEIGDYFEVLVSLLDATNNRATYASLVR
jgi:hypothetical protein